jgi:membrane associated rhomboid family serine protease
MIPLSDASRRPERFPAVTVVLIALNVAMFSLELAGGEAFILQWTAVPNEMGSPHGWVTLLTAMFLHAGPAHLFGNMVFFWAFGPIIEDAMGRGRFLMFYLLGGLLAFAGQIAIVPSLP